MSGQWRISERAEIDALREARRIARLSRSEAAWAQVELQVSRIRHLGIPESEWLDA
jgi:hypothetical protein